MLSGNLISLQLVYNVGTSADDADECHTAVRWFLKLERVETTSKATRLAQNKLQNLELQATQLSNCRLRPSFVFSKAALQEQPNLFARESTAYASTPPLYAFVSKIFHIVSAVNSAKSTSDSLAIMDTAAAQLSSEIQRYE